MPTWKHTYAGNPHLIYAIVRRKATFETLANLTLPVALEQAQANAARHGVPHTNTYVGVLSCFCCDVLRSGAQVCVG